MPAFVFLLCLTSSTYAAPLFIESTSVSTNTNCGEIDCATVHMNCTEICGCDKWYYYDNSTNECLINLNYLKQIMVEEHNTEEQLRQRAEKVFKGIILSAYFFIFCATICALAACVYCCRLNYSDYRLNKDVKALAKKLHRDGKSFKKPIEKRTQQPIAESCNVVVEDAGVFVC